MSATDALSMYVINQRQLRGQQLLRSVHPYLGEVRLEKLILEISLLHLRNGEIVSRRDIASPRRHADGSQYKKGIVPCWSISRASCALNLTTDDRRSSGDSTAVGVLGPVRSLVVQWAPVASDGVGVLGAWLVAGDEAPEIFSRELGPRCGRVPYDGWPAARASYHGEILSGVGADVMEQISMLTGRRLHCSSWHDQHLTVHLVDVQLLESAKIMFFVL